MKNPETIKTTCIDKSLLFIRKKHIHIYMMMSYDVVLEYCDYIIFIIVGPPGAWHPSPAAVPCVFVYLIFRVVLLPNND